MRGYYGTRSREVLLRGPEHEYAARPAQPSAASARYYSAQPAESVYFNPVAPTGYQYAPAPPSQAPDNQPMPSSRSKGFMGPDGVKRY